MITIRISEPHHPIYDMYGEGSWWMMSWNYTAALRIPSLQLGLRARWVTGLFETEKSWRRQRRHRVDPTFGPMGVLLRPISHRMVNLAIEPPLAGEKGIGSKFLAGPAQRRYKGHDYQHDSRSPGCRLASSGSSDFGKSSCHFGTKPAHDYVSGCWRQNPNSKKVKSDFHLWSLQTPQTVGLSRFSPGFPHGIWISPFHPNHLSEIQVMGAWSFGTGLWILMRSPWNIAPPAARPAWWPFTASTGRWGLDGWDG